MNAHDIWKIFIFFLRPIRGSIAYDNQFIIKFCSFEDNIHGDILTFSKKEPFDVTLDALKKVEIAKNKRENPKWLCILY